MDFIHTHTRQPVEEGICSVCSSAVRATPLGGTAGQVFRVRYVLVLEQPTQKRLAPKISVGTVGLFFLQTSDQMTQPLLFLKYAFVCWPQNPEVCFSVSSLP